MADKKVFPSTDGAQAAHDPSVDPRAYVALDKLQKAGAQLMVRLGVGVYISTVVGLGRDGFFIDTLTPPEGDEFLGPGKDLRIETLIGGVSFTFDTRVIKQVEFLDELPAFKLEYPKAIKGEKRRKSPRTDTRGTASLSFLRPFSLDAPVLDISPGGLAVEYPADLGRLKPGARIEHIMLEMGINPVVGVDAVVVATMVAEVGGISLPSRYRSSLKFENVSTKSQMIINQYIEKLKERSKGELPW